MKVIRRLILLFCVILSVSGCSAVDSEQDPLNSIGGETSEKPSSSNETEMAPSEENEQPNITYVNYLENGGDLELPAIGATGYTAVQLRLRKEGDSNAEVITTLNAGQAFQILEEKEGWWKIDIGKQIGWVNHTYCFINLPDVIPSIVYDNSNSYESKYTSSGYAIPNLTGEQLYQSFAYNERLEEEEYFVPVLYAMAKKICAAQQAAISENNTLIIYEGFRPYEVQQKIVKNLTILANENEAVNSGISTEPWTLGWFIARSISNHQRGYAIDVSLGKILEQDNRLLGEYKYTRTTEYEEYTMPTAIHELSIASVIFESPINSKSPTAWKEATPANTMNEAAFNLQRYCTNAGMTPLASEWWHFNDLDCAKIADADIFQGKFYI